MTVPMASTVELQLSWAASKPPKPGRSSLPDSLSLLFTIPLSRPGKEVLCILQPRLSSSPRAQASAQATFLVYYLSNSAQKNTTGAAAAGDKQKENQEPWVQSEPCH